MIPEASERIDKWLWAARFYKTRSLAKTAVDGGHVHVNGTRVKPARMLHAGDTLDITIGTHQRTVTVIGLSERRGPAPVAQQLYAETPESLARAEAERVQRQAQGATRPGARPTKRDRRLIHRFNESSTS